MVEARCERRSGPRARARCWLAALALGLPLVGSPALTALAPPPRAPRGEEGRAREAIKLWETAARQQGMASTALLALADLAGHDHPLTVAALLGPLDHELALFHPTARRVLGGFTRVESLEHVARRGLAHRNPAVRAQVLMALAAGRPAALDWRAALRAGLDDPAPLVRAVAVRSLGRVRSQEDLPAILDRLGDDAVRVRQELPEAIARLAPVRALPMLDVLAQDERWRVRLAVVRALTALRTLPAAERLIDVLAAEPGRLREDAILALQELTGRNFGLSIAAWRRLLEREGPSVLEIGDGEGATGEMPSIVRYYGLGTLSQRFVFVTDLSGSMGSPAMARYREAGGSRLEHTRHELRQLIDGLDDEMAFNLITFTDDVEPWRSRLLRADPKTRRRALAEIDGWVADGGTNIQGALDAAFDLAQAELDGSQSLGPDTVFLLSDGEPSAGVVRETRLLLQHAAERNRDLHLRIHCISLTSSSESRRFLQALATGTDGRYVNPLD